MYREIYHHQKVSVSAIQVISVIMVVAFAYVLPVYLITAYQVQESSVYTAESLRDREGQVAGISTSTDSRTGQVTLNLLGNKVQLPTETSMLLVAGTALSAVGCVLVIGLLFTKRRAELTELEHSRKIS